MLRSPDAVRRVIAVLNFFVGHPAEAFTLADLVRALKLSRATCQGVVNGLVDAGYLFRTSDKTYVLGPALSVMSEAVRETYTPLTVARPEMRALSDRYNAICTAAFRNGTSSLVRERASSASHVGYMIPRGSEWPLSPEVAAIFFIWSDASTVAEWLSSLSRTPSEAQLEAMRGSINFVRSHGFAFATRTTRSAEPGLSPDLYGQGHLAGPMSFQPHLDPARTYAAVVVQAPVYEGRDVAFALNLQGFDSPLSGQTVLEMGEAVRDAAERISSFMNHTGRNPGLGAARR